MLLRSEVTKDALEAIETAVLEDIDLIDLALDKGVYNNIRSTRVSEGLRYY